MKYAYRLPVLLTVLIFSNPGSTQTQNEALASIVSQLDSNFACFLNGAADRDRVNVLLLGNSEQTRALLLRRDLSECEFRLPEGGCILSSVESEPRLLPAIEVCKELNFQSVSLVRGTVSPKSGENLGLRSEELLDIARNAPVSATRVHLEDRFTAYEVKRSPGLTNGLVYRSSAGEVIAQHLLSSLGDLNADFFDALLSTYAGTDWLAVSGAGAADEVRLVDTTGCWDVASESVFRLNQQKYLQRLDELGYNATTEYSSIAALDFREALFEVVRSVSRHSNQLGPALIQDLRLLVLSGSPC